METQYQILKVIPQRVTQFDKPGHNKPPKLTLIKTFKQHSAARRFIQDTAFIIRYKATP